METIDHDRDVFIVHTKSDERESALVEALVPMLHGAGIHTWLYDDWSWEHRVRRRGRGAPKATGRLEELDLSRYAAGDPMPFRAAVDEVDEGTLAQMIHASRVVVLCEPIDGGPSEGVAVERKVIAGLAAGPILLHLLWPDSGGHFFARLRPTTRLKLPHETPNDAVVNEAFAAVASAWLVYNLQRMWGRQGGHRLLRIVAGRQPGLAELIENSPQFLEPEEPAITVPRSPEAASIAEIFARMRPHEARMFEEWWNGDAAALRALTGGAGDGAASTSLQGLVEVVDRSWREAFSGEAGS